MAIFFAWTLTSELDALCGENVNPIRHKVPSGFSSLSDSSKRKKDAQGVLFLFGGTDGS